MNEFTIGDEVAIPSGCGEIIKTDDLQNGEELLYIFEAPETIHKYPSSVDIVRAK